MRCDTCDGAGRIRSGFLCPICDGAGELDWQSPDFAAPDAAIAELVDAKLATANRSTRRAAVPSRDHAQPATASRRQP
jgi:RecJ-like exonuclease